MSSERRVPNFRAKVYQLQSDSNWEDMGTGNCIYEMGVEGDPDMLVVQSEENGRYILNSEVITGRFFQKQQETLIVWTDYTGKDLALSFQDSLGCDKIWQYIGEGRANIGEHMQPLIQIQTTNGLIPLYDLQLSTLKETAEVILSFLPEEREKMISFIISSDCVNKLVKLFQSIDLKDPSSQMDTQNMFNLIFALMSLQERRIIDTITQSQNIYTIIYILELDPALPKSKTNYRRQLRKAESGKQLVKVRDAAMEQTIRQTIRLSFLEGIVRQLNCWGPSPFELDGVISILSSLHFQNCSDIINYIHESDYFLDELFKLAREKPETQKEVMGFVIELYAMSKPMPNTVKDRLFKAMAGYGLFDLLSFGLKNSNIDISRNAAIILDNFTELDAPFVRTEILIDSNNEDREETLLHVLIAQYNLGRDHMAMSVHETLRHLLDQSYTSPDNANDASADTAEMNHFLQYFYDSHINTLLSPIQTLTIKPHNLTGPVERIHLTKKESDQMDRLCSLISFLIKSHGFRSKYIIVSSDLITRITQLLRADCPIVQSSVIRFYKTCIAVKDEFYNRNLMIHNIFEPFMRVLVDTNAQDCLLNSSCMSLIALIIKEKVRSLIDHLIEQFGSVLNTMNYATVFHGLRAIYKENKLPSTSPETKDATSEPLQERVVTRNGWVSGTVDEEEEDYFNASDDDEEEEQEDTDTAETPLVMYSDNEEEDTNATEPPLVMYSDNEEEDTNATEPPLVMYNDNEEEDGEEDGNDDVNMSTQIERNPNKENGPEPTTNHTLSPKKKPVKDSNKENRVDEEETLTELTQQKSLKSRKRSSADAELDDEEEVSMPKSLKSRKQSSADEKLDGEKEVSMPESSKSRKQFSADAELDDEEEVSMPKSLKSRKQFSADAELDDEKEVSMPESSKSRKQFSADEKLDDEEEVSMPKSLKSRKRSSADAELDDEEEVSMPETKKPTTTRKS